MTSFAAREITPGAEDEYRITVTVNGERRVVEVEPRLLLAHLLREGLGLTGTHLGCDTTNCGACTVLVDGTPVKSCTMLAVQADGREVTTVEGLGTAERARPGAGGLLRRARPAVRLLHPRDDAVRPRPAGPRTRIRPKRTCAGRSRATSAAAPATRTSSRPCCGRRARRRVDDRARRDHDRRPGREPPPGRGRAVRPRPRPLRRRHPPARHAAHGDPAQPAGARPDRLDRHVEGLGDPGRPAGAHRRDDGPAQPRLDADALLRHPGRARHRQGALPGPGGVRRRRRRPVHRQGRVRGDRRRVRGAARDRQPGAGGAPPTRR